jgi:hypothetical protein
MGQISVTSAEPSFYLMNPRISNFVASIHHWLTITYWPGALTVGPPSSVSKNEPSSAWYPLHVGFFSGLLFYLEN